MKSPDQLKSEANEFIAKNLAEFGVLGSNNFGPLLKSYDGLFLKDKWSFNNHYKFGFNGQSFNYRQSHSDFYWVDYSDKPRDSSSGTLSGTLSKTLGGGSSGASSGTMSGASSGGLDLMSQIREAVQRFYKKVGRFSIPGHGGILSEMLICVCQDLQIPVSLVQLDFAGETSNWPSYTGLKVEKIRTNPLEISNFFQEFNEISPCVDAEIIFNVFLGAKSDLPHIYDTNIGLQFTDFNFDDDRVVGPTNWVLVDAEKRTAPCRYLDQMKKVGWVEFFHESPDLMKSYMENPLFVNMVNEKNDGKRSKDNFVNHVGMIRSLFPQIPDRDYFNLMNPKLQLWLREQSKALEQNPRLYCRDIWTTPLSAFGRLWGLNYNFYGGADQDYGTVF